ncbi:MAG: DUF2807 domain-containing protein [Sphingomonadales bacterium]|jgi:hypothetical protein|nr:DUF2807 domain-containing protein [Sphingomonadales bacterium]MBK9004178.1 DUF2807 domain-containing protein [Sphingomonadales bacterium]MBK9269355.1 DUF2807 domain-containing protein [Sphingomonadales bacterium]
MLDLGPKLLYPLFAFTISVGLPVSASAATKTFLIGSYEELLVEGDITVILDNNRTPSAKASGDRALVEALKIERNGLFVRVRIQDYEGKTQSARVNQPLVVHLGGRGVTRISADGSASISVNQLRSAGGTATLKLSGPGSIAVDRLESDRANLSVTGSGGITIGGGKVRVGQINMDGTGTISAAPLAIQQAKLTQSGNARTHLSVSEQIDISNSGAGTITIDGKATCFIRQPGSARIKCGKLTQP